MAHRLRQMKIHEVSSVDRGAGEGVEVVLIKRHDDLRVEIEKAFAALNESYCSIFECDESHEEKLALIEETTEQAKEHIEALINDRVEKRNATIDRVAALAAATARQHGGMDHDAAIRAVLGRDPDVAQRYLEAGGVIPPDPNEADTVGLDLDDKENTMDTLKIAKAVLNGEPVGSLRRAQCDDELTRRAVAHHADHPEMTFAKAYVEILGSPEGRALYGARKMLKPDSEPTRREAPERPMPRSTPSYRALMAKAKELMARDAKLTEAIAFAKVYSDPQNAELANAERAERRRAAA